MRYFNDKNTDFTARRRFGSSVTTIFPNNSEAADFIVNNFNTAYGLGPNGETMINAHFEKWAAGGSQFQISAKCAALTIETVQA